MSVRRSVSRRLQRTPPLQRLVATAFHPSRKGERLAAFGRALRFEVNTTVLGRPTELPIGERSKLIAYRGETNSPHAVIRNPPNWPEMLVWKQHLRPGDLFVDVGANIGAYTIYALEQGALVIAVEPVAHNADRVREHLALNGYTAEVLQEALTDQPGVVHMTTDQDSYNHITVADQPGVEVEATTLDLLLDGRSAAVKIDVEGAEALVLAGAVESLKAHRIRLLQLEWAVGDWMTIADREDARTILDEAGYRLYLPDRAGNLAPMGDHSPPSVNVFAMPHS